MKETAPTVTTSATFAGAMIELDATTGDSPWNSENSSILSDPLPATSMRYVPFMLAWN